MPGWAIALAAAIASVCIAVFAVVLVVRSNQHYRHDVYERCLVNNASSGQFVDAFGKLRNADQSLVTVISESAKNQPTTPAGRAIIDAFRQQVSAYDQLLALVPKKLPSCDKLK